jgi:hypothetical protein
VLLSDNFDTEFSVPTNGSTALGYWQTKLGESLKIITWLFVKLLIKAI